MTTLYLKAGRRYVVWGHAEQYDHDLMRAGQWRMTYCARDGLQRYRYDVRPDTASFLAACELARDAMEEAIGQQAIARPRLGVTPYTRKQLQLIERFRADMAAAGGFAPTHWTHSSAGDIAQAGIEAVRRFAEGTT